MRSVRVFCLTATVLLLAASAIAQEGHPLTGTWYGDFGSTANKRNDLTVILKWDGVAITGLVNPGPNSTPIKSARLDVKLGNPGSRGGGGGQRGGAAPQAPPAPPVPATPPTFLVQFEIDAKGKNGATDHFVFEGKIENPVAGNRTIVGTWTCGSDRGDFRLRRM
jgi:hypothetical protein